jgi:hypothetical protein
MPFDQIFDIERVYGSETDRDSTGRFPCDFDILDLDGEVMLIINHFRDQINFRDATFYSITRKFLDGARSLERPSSADSTSFQNSYYQVATSASGKVLTGSFYDDALFLFDARPRISIRDQIPTRID